jgi:hypothetical protein
MHSDGSGLILVNSAAVWRRAPPFDLSDAEQRWRESAPAPLCRDVLP